MFIILFGIRKPIDVDEALMDVQRHGIEIPLLMRLIARLGVTRYLPNIYPVENYSDL